MHVAADDRGLLGILSGSKHAGDVWKHGFFRSELLSAYKGVLDKPTVDRILELQGLDPTCRAEELDVDAMLALFEQVTLELNTTSD